MQEIKEIQGVQVSRSKRWPNYGVSKCGRAFRWDTEKEMSVGMMTAGDYPVFRVSHSCKASWACIHYAVIECWVENDDPEFKIEVNHKNGDKFDYSFENLEWVTKSQNQRHALDTGLSGKGELLYNAGLTDTQVHLVCQELQHGARPKDLALKYDVSSHIVRKIRDGSTYFHIRSLYPINHDYRKDFSEATVRWVCDQIIKGMSDKHISDNSTNKDLVIIEVKRIRNKIRYKNISDEYF